MYLLTIHTKFAAAHHLINYEGPCENLHGHNWKVEVVVSARQLDKAGMGIDFKVLKRKTKKLSSSLIISTSMTSLPSTILVLPRKISHGFFSKNWGLSSMTTM
jgi:6-pyruvoyl-tetrahydropterin synthase